MAQSPVRFAILVLLALAALAEAELWRRRPVFTADAVGGVYLSRSWGRSYYCNRGECALVGRARSTRGARPE